MCKEDTAIDLLTEVMDKEGLTVWATDKYKEILVILHQQEEEVTRSHDTKQALYNEIDRLTKDLRDIRGGIRDTLRSFNYVLSKLEE